MTGSYVTSALLRVVVFIECVLNPKDEWCCGRFLRFEFPFFLSKRRRS